MMFHQVTSILLQNLKLLNFILPPTLSHHLQPDLFMANQVAIRITSIHIASHANILPTTQQSMDQILVLRCHLNKILILTTTIIGNNMIGGMMIQIVDRIQRM